MSKQRYINTKIWEDAWFSSLDQIEQLVFIYFLTNPMTNICGAYELSKGTIGRAVGLESLTLETILKRFEDDKKVFYRNGWVIIPNFIKHQNNSSPKIKKGIENELESVPNEIKELLGYGIHTVSHLIKSNLIKSNLIESNLIKEEKETLPKEETAKFFQMVVEGGEAFEEFIENFSERTEVTPALALREIKKFTNYWCEKSQGGKKLKWEMEKTFEIQRRLSKWFGNASQWSHEKKISKEKNFVV